MIEAPLWARVNRNGEKGVFRVKRMVCGSTTATTMSSGNAPDGPCLRVIRRSKENFTAIASTGAPSSNLLPGLSLNSQTRLSGETVQLSARSPWTSVLLLSPWIL
ncbi:hypothetical protein D3C75_1191540 [compost metagenome]